MRLKLVALVATLLATAPALAEKPAEKPAAKTAVAKSQLKIEGMHCQGCAGGIVNQLQRLKGVKSAKVDAKSKIGTVEYDPKQVKPADLVERVKVAGFLAKVVK
jgi:copper chaperone CopZ